MRWSLALFLLIAAPTAAIVEDDSGDAAGGGLADGAPSPVQGALDLIGLQVEERPLEFVFHLEVADLASGGPGDEAVSYRTEFRYGDQSYAVGAFRTALPGGDPSYGASLQVYDEGQDWFVYVTQLDITTDGNTMSVVVPRDLVRDGNGAPPLPGRAFEEIFVESFSLRTGDICLPECVEQAYWGDRMPDEGVADQVHAIVYGAVQDGHARLESKQPYRASNGEATTFVFHIDAKNLGDEDDRFDFNVTGAPPQWDVRVPSGVRIEAGSTIEVPIVVRTAFAHAHGSATTFLLEMRSIRDAGSVGRLEMGIYYPDPPQPAGHHDTLWLHTVDESDDMLLLLLYTSFEAALGQQGYLESEYMNTLEDDELADEIPSDGRYCGFLVSMPDALTFNHCWDFPLAPGLEMGLDFDLDARGALDVTIGSEVPMLGTTVKGTLVYQEPVENPEDPFGFFNREETVLAHLNATEAKDINALSQETFSLEVVPTTESDLVPFKEGAGLVLRLQATSLRPENPLLGPRPPPPTMEAGARLQLPLLEYADPVEGTVNFGGAVLLDPVTDQERRVNPGKTVLFKATLKNVDSDEHTFRLDLVGSHREWSRLLAPDTLTLGPGQESSVALAVSPPQDAASGDRADLVLEAASQQDLGARALVRFVAEVTTEEDLPDESEAAGMLEHAPAKKSPAGPAALVLLLALALRRRT